MRTNSDHHENGTGTILGRDTSGGVPVNAYTILIVDCLRANRDLLAKMLGALGYRTICARDGIEALDRIHRQPAPDLIITAVELPRMNGIDTISAIRHLSSPMRKLPIAAITADVPQHLIRELPAAGADFLLPRPFDMAELAKAVSSLLRGQLEEIPAEFLRRSFGVSA